MKVIELARSLGITPGTVRFYTRIKVLEPKKNKGNGYRDYSEKDVSRLRFVLSARQLGFSVKDVQKILDDANEKESPCPTVRRLIDERLRESEQRFRENVQLRDHMQHAVREWGRNPGEAPIGNMISDLIEHFARPTPLDNSS